MVIQRIPRFGFGPKQGKVDIATHMKFLTGFLHFVDVATIRFFIVGIENFSTAPFITIRCQV